MNDIVERLDAVAGFGGTHLDGLWSEASKEIKRLRHTEEHWRSSYNNAIVFRQVWREVAEAREREIARLREALEKIVTLRPKPIGDSGFEQGPRLLLDQCQKIARAALAEKEKTSG